MEREVTASYFKIIPYHLCGMTKENNMLFKEECAGIRLFKYFISLLAFIGYVCCVCVTALIRCRAST